MQAAKKETFRTQLIELRDRLDADMRELAGEVLDAPVGKAQGPEDGHDPSIAQYERDMQLMANEQRMRDDIADALARIDKGTYGTCEACGAAIAEARLEALPFARHCIACAAKQ
jgi:RNA polymerase-binding protein DksA